MVSHPLLCSWEAGAHWNLELEPANLCSYSKNCTKHNCRCDYMDQPPLEDESATSPTLELLMDPQIIEELTHWRTTGQAPFPELGPPSQPYWDQFSIVDHRLLHHIAGLSHGMHRQGYSEFTIWATKMPESVVSGSLANKKGIDFATGFLQ